MIQEKTPDLNRQKQFKQQLSNNNLINNQTKISINVTNPKYNINNRNNNNNDHSILNNIDYIKTKAATTIPTSLPYNNTTINNCYQVNLKSIIDLSEKNIDYLNSKPSPSKFTDNHTEQFNENVNRPTWYHSEKIDRTTTNSHSNDQITSIEINPSSSPLVNRQEITIMSNNKDHKNPVGELSSSATTTTTGKVQHHHHQQQQIYQVTNQPPLHLQQHPQRFTSGYVKDKSNSLNVNVKQNTSDKLKLIDSRRTTPRQLKQHQLKRSQPISHSSLTTSTEPPPSTTVTMIPSELYQQKYTIALNHPYSEKTKTTTSPENFHSSMEKSTFPQQMTSSDLATSFIRTASLHLKSTLSRLKRSNSGHSNKPSDIITTTTTHTDVLPSVKTINVNESVMRRSSLPSDNNDKSIKLIDEINGNTKRLYQEFNTISKNDSKLSSSPPGCTKWSTRLGPPPPPCKTTDITAVTYPKCCISKTSHGTNTSETAVTTTINPTRLPLILPKNERNELNLSLTGGDDCADFGEFGRINLRTGSFMGRYPNYSHSNYHLMNYAQNGQHRQYLLSGNDNSSSGIQQQQQRQDEQQNLPDYRPLYLSVQPYTTLSPSGNTTRSAPSPSLSSTISTQGIPGYNESSQQQQIVYFRPQSRSINLKASSSSSVTMTRSPRVNSMHNPQLLHTIDNPDDQYSIPITHPHEMLLLSSSSSPSCVSPHPELDPILERLLLDVTSIDEYRTALHRNDSVTPPLSTNRQRTINRIHTPLGSSDPESISRSADHITNVNLSNKQLNILHDNIWNLNKQINDLIQMEFNTKQKQPTVNNKSPFGTLKIDCSTVGPRRSAPNVQVEEEEEENSKTEADIQSTTQQQQLTDETPPATGTKTGKYTSFRKHPFRWSSRTRSSSHKKIILTHTQSSVGRSDQHINKDEHTIHLSTSSLQATPTKSIRTTRNNKSTKNLPVNDCDNNNNDNTSISYNQLNGEQQPSVISSRMNPLNSSSNLLDTKNVLQNLKKDDYVTFWSLSVGQITILRKLALIQLASIADKHCSINRSPFSWRFMKYRALLTSGDSNLISNSLSTSPLSDKKPFSSTNNEMSVNNLNSTEPNSLSHHHQTQSPGCERIPQLPIRRISYTGPVFGQSLSSWQRRLGYPLPPAIVHMMDHLELNGTTAHGLFRRPGGKSRILALREEIERDINWRKFDDWQPYDIADLLKQFFRELPECLFTSKLATVLVNVYICVPNSVQIDLLRWILISLPDENRLVLQKLLYLLNHLSRHSDVTEMSASNLAVCFAPSLYRLIKPSSLSTQGVSLSPRRLRRTTSGPDPKDLADQHAAQLSLSAMITLAPNLFQISCSLLEHSTLLTSLTPLAQDLESLIPNGDWPQWIQNSLTDLIRECSSSKSKGWNTINRDVMKYYNVDSGVNESLDNFEIHYKKIPTSTESKSTSNSLRLWRCSLYIPETNPRVILNRFVETRSSWDPEVVQMAIVDQISDSVDLCELHLSSTYPQPKCLLQLLRGIQYTLDDGSCAMLSESICNSAFSITDTTHSMTTLSTSPSMNVLGHVYEDHVYIRPDNNGRGCRVYLLSRVDVKGYGPDWYVNQWGHTLCRRLINLRRSFQKSGSPVLVYELEDSISRPSPPPYSTVTVGTLTTTTTVSTSTHIPVSSPSIDTSSISTDILINRF
ncbi:rho-type gtpase activating protein, putative [Schistosoma mansoni]|uniref:rho-type gtpase activating protein, putative n=1 Tax=Schistosoma mansoni TaxID=6183 RepID=UPI0001A63A3E|nr:rho-type gtpase activating protein, putative [Schistosoma mansoni]|eukprot:XP_018645543.1 rho-type gtpase activating protein, putative [Schistosoma mansoni]